MHPPTCTICSSDLSTGAVYTAECSHQFHYNCVYNHVRNANNFCPTCRSVWTQLPSPFPPPSNNSPFTCPVFQPPPAPGVSPFNFFRNERPPAFESFKDDEPLPSSATVSGQPTQQGGVMTVKALPEYPALSKSDKSDSFPVLVSIRAPLLSAEAADARAPLDLVAVLDVSGSMYGNKLSLLKQAVSFVVKNLGPRDRLSIITFATNARRLTPLRRMTEAGQTDTLRAVTSIQTEGSTNIIAGLRTAVNVLDQRREKNPVTSIILLSDGQDNQNHNFISCLSQLPHIRSNASEPNQSRPPSDVFQVYTFGFGSDHDATALHAISDGSGGTFSYIEAIEVIQDAFAQCLGGLLSVVAQEVELQVRSGSPDVVIKSIPSGRHRNTIDSFGGQHGVVYVGDVYADETKQFLVYLSVPKIEQENNTLTTKLLEVKCSYNNPLSKEKIVSDTAIAEIRRPLKEALSEEDKQVCLEVDRERNRISIADGIVQAQKMAERGELAGARSLLQGQSATLLSSYAGKVGDAPTMSLFGQAKVMEQCMESKDLYAGSGRAFGYSTTSSHNYQRANTQAAVPTAVSFGAPGVFRSNTSGFGNQGAFGSVVGGGASFSSTGFGGPAVSITDAAASPNQSFAFQTSYMQEMVQKSQQERKSSWLNEPSAKDGSANP